MADFFVGAVLGIAVVFAAKKIIKDKKSGNGCCGGSCEGCNGCDRK